MNLLHNKNRYFNKTKKTEEFSDLFIHHTPRGATASCGRMCDNFNSTAGA